jgi:hypothetical protein
VSESTVSRKKKREKIVSREIERVRVGSLRLGFLGERGGEEMGK